MTTHGIIKLHYNIIIKTSPFVSLTTSVLAPHPNRRVSTMVSRCNTSLGMPDRDFPLISIGARGDWCSNVYTERECKRSYIPTSRDDSCFKIFPQLNERHIEQVIVHTDTVTFEKKKRYEDLPSIKFIVNNRGNGRDSCLLCLYSTQTNEMVFDGFVTRGGDRSILDRYQDADRAIGINCSSLTNLFQQTEPVQAFKQVMSSNVCGFSLLCKKVKYDDCRGLAAMGRPTTTTDQTDGGNTTTAKGLVAQTDGGNTTTTTTVVQTDGGTITTMGMVARTDLSYHTNLVRGLPTGTKLKYVCVEDIPTSPVHIYNIIIMMTEATNIDF